MSYSDSWSLSSPTTPDHLYTWVDIDRYFTDLAAMGLWPEWLHEVDAYWDSVRFMVEPGTQSSDFWGFLADVLGPLTVDGERQSIILDSASVESENRTLHIEIIEAEDGIPQERRPQWRTPRVVRDLSSPLLAPEQRSLPGVSVCAFHSFKGGVGRTLHCIATAAAVAARGARVLVVDADLEAPGVTWLARAQGLRLDFSFEDFLALVHGSTDDRYEDAVDIGGNFLRNQELDGVIIMPARRDYRWLEPPRIEPVDLLTSDRDPFVLTEVLARLARKLSVSVIVVDLRAGVSELNAPLLLDSRLHRVFVSTISNQSVIGSRRIIEEVTRRAPARQESDDPIPMTLLTQFNLPDHREQVADAAEYLRAPIVASMSGTTIGGSEDADLLVPLMTSDFHPRLLDPPASWTGVRDLVVSLGLDKSMSPLVDFLVPEIERPSPHNETPEALDRIRRRLQTTAQQLIYAETSVDEGFLVTEALDTLVESHKTEVPIEVVIGAKGSGKTFTFLQMCARDRWSDFAYDVGMSDVTASARIVPVIESQNVGPERAVALANRRGEISSQIGGGKPAHRLDAAELIRHHVNLGSDETTWRRVWLTCFARAIGLKADPENAQEVLAGFARRGRLLFVLDGLEDIFHNFAGSDSEQRALRVLLTDCPEWFRSLRQRPLGLIVFIRRDLAQIAVTQNFGQFEARYANYSLRWNRDEALRLAAWVCQRGGALPCDEPKIRGADAADLSRLMVPVWGEKMGSPKSKEARSELWFFAALSDFSGQIQARDIVTFIGASAEKSVGDRKWPNRVLSPGAMRNALPVCSGQKIEAIRAENPPVGALLSRLSDRSAEQRKVPFSLDSVALTQTDARLLEANGVVFREGDQYWIPEIFRHGLGFRAVGRPRVLSIANLVRRRNDLGA